MRIDARTGRARTTAVVRNPQTVAAGADSVWTADFWDSTVTRFSAQPGQRLATIPLKLPHPVALDDDRFLPFDLTTGEGGVWVATARGYVARIDAATNRVTTMVKTAADATGPIVAGGGAIWIGQDLQLGRLDPATGRLSNTTIDGPGGRRFGIGALTFADGALWAGGGWATPSRGAEGHTDYTATDDNAIAEINPATGTARSVTPLPRGAGLRSDQAGLWLTNARSNKLYEFNPRTRRVVAAAHVRTPTGAVIPAPGHRVWVQRSAHQFALVNLMSSR